MHVISADTTVADTISRYDSIRYTQYRFRYDTDPIIVRSLLSKLDHLGIRGRTKAWISSFLFDQSQRVVLNGAQSSWIPVLSSVPQGTVLGPLLFLLYVNDITHNISSEIRLFADDCILYRQIRMPSDCQQDITRLYNWSLTWQMVFNTKKCHILSILRKRDRPTITYTLGTEKLSVVESYPYLGVTVSSDLRWHHYINTISNKANRTLNFIRRNIYRCSPEAKVLAYTSLVRPHLEYASAVWDPYIARDSNKLDKSRDEQQRLSANHISISTHFRIRLAISNRKTENLSLDAALQSHQWLGGHPSGRT